MHTTHDPHADADGSLAPLGYALAAVSLLAVFALMHHPVGHGRQPADILASIRQQTRMDQTVHAGLAMVFGFLAAAMSVFAGRLGLQRFPVVLGLTAFVCASVLTVLAAMTDGFVIPALAAHCAADPSASCVSDAASLARLSALQIEYLTRFSCVGFAAAALSWSVALMTTPNLPVWTGWLGLASGGWQVAGLFLAAGRLTPASLLMIFSGQLAWYLLVAVLLIRRAGPFAADCPTARYQPFLECSKSTSGAGNVST